MAYPRFLRARAHKVIVRTAGDYTAGSGNGGAKTAIDSPNWDIALPAAVGDVLEVCVSGYWNSAAVVSHLEIATMVSAAAVNSVGGGSGANSQLPGTYIASGVGGGFTAIAHYTVVAGDIVSGKVTVRLFRQEESTVDRTLHANTTRPLQMWAKNLGPVAPH